VGREVLGPEGIVLAEQRHDLVHPAPHMCLPRTDLKALIEDLHQRHRVDCAAVDAAHRHGATSAHRVDAGEQGAEAVDARSLDQRSGERVG
jgi:hypothetical protein